MKRKKIIESDSSSNKIVAKEKQAMFVATPS